MSVRKAVLVLATLAALCAFYPALFGERPAPLQSSALLVPDPREPRSRNDELSDVVTQFVPWSRAVADAYRAGRMPFWFPANGCGAPLWANPQAQAATPTTLFFLFLPDAWASAAGAAVKLLAAAAGAFLLARRRALSAEASLWAALAYGFALHAVNWMHFPHTWPVALLPWTLVALDRVARDERGQRGGFAATVAAVALLLSGGYPETEFLAAVCGAAYFFAVLLAQPSTAGERLRRFGIAAAASVLALGLTAAYTLPATAALLRSERSAQVARASAASEPLRLHARDFLRPPTYWDIARFWVVPEAQGNPRDGDKFGPYSFAGRTSGYTGVLVLAFALATFGWRRAPRGVALARIGAVLTAAYVLWYPPLVWLLHRTPGLREAAARLTTNRANTVLVMLLALLAACELDRLRRGGRSGATRAACVIVLAATALVAFEFARAAERPPVTAWRAVSFALPAVLLVAAIGLLSRASTPASRTALATFVLAATALDLLRIGARINPGTLPAEDYPVTPAVRALQEASRGGRFAASDGVLTGMASHYGLEDVRILNPAAPADYEDVLTAAAGYTGPVANTPRVARLDAPFLDFLNVRARAGWGVAVPPTREAAAAVLPDRVLGVSSFEALLARLPAHDDFTRSALVVGARDETFEDAAEVVSVARPRPEEIRVRVRTASPRLLVVPEVDDGGWTARGERRKGAGGPRQRRLPRGARPRRRVGGGLPLLAAAVSGWRSDQRAVGPGRRRSRVAGTNTSRRVGAG